MSAPEKRRWMDSLEDEDLAFIKRLRLRLDRLIDKIKILDNQNIDDDFERQLRAQFADGKLDSQVFKRLLAAYQEQKKETK